MAARQWLVADVMVIDHVWTGSDLVVSLKNGEGINVEIIDAVVDLDEGEAIGVEILGLVYRHPQVPMRVKELREAGGDGIISCDAAADAVYIRFKNGRSIDQTVRPAVVVLGPDDRLLKVLVQMEPQLS